MNDTDPQIAELVRLRMLERSGTERLKMGSRMFEVAKAVVLSSLPDDLTDLEIKIRLCERFYGNEVNTAAFAEYLQSLPISTTKT